MSKCSWWRGGHNFVIVAKGTQKEIWCESYQGAKLVGSEYTRDRPTIIEQCTKCQEFKASDGFERTLVSIDFAKKKILGLGGIIGKEVQ